MKIYKNVFEKIIALDNLFLAWDEFKKDKKQRKDVQKFEWKLEENIFELHRNLKAGKYRHGTYTSFFIQDPKQRHIHKATVGDRVLHHAIFKVVNPIFEPTFISHSFSCRVGKGTHKGVDNISSMLHSVSGNGFKPCFALKCDIKKFFDSVDHNVLVGIIQKRIKDKKAMELLEEVIESFASKQSDIFYKKGLPIGNLTSQLFANIYLNELDQFVKHELRVRYYCRYTDDFIIASNDQIYLKELSSRIGIFLTDNLRLELHPKKITIRKFQQGIDFLGYVLLPYHKMLRTKTRKRLMKRIEKRISEYKSGRIAYKTLEQSLHSCLGVLTHADAYGFSEWLKNQFWFWLTN
jgi:retron-type reverse transcriptase